MYEIGIVGDVHLDTRISSRKDDYFQTCLNKLSEVANNCKNIIVLGDFFNREVIPNEYLFNLYIHLSYLKNKNGNTFYSIIGNHDIFNEVEETLSKTSLGICKISKLINIITAEQPTIISGQTFYTSYVNLDKCREHLKTLKLSKDSILLLHQYFEDAYEGVTYEELREIGCSKIFFGHEHSFFNGFRKQFPEFTAYRCGSLLRSAANENNLKRDIFYFVLDNDIRVCKLECTESAKNVFTEKAFTQENLNRTKFVKNISEVLDKYDNNISTQAKFSLKIILEEIHTPRSCMNYISDKYNKINEVLN